MMNKEMIIPIVVGFTVGIIVMYGIVTATRSLKDQDTVSPEPTTITQDSPTPQSNNPTNSPQSEESNFTIVNPYPHALVNDDNLIIRGFTSKNDQVVIINENTTLSTTPNDKGEFETEIKLTQGSNYLTFFSIDPQGQSKRIDQTVVFSTN